MIDARRQEYDGNEDTLVERIVTYFPPSMHLLCFVVGRWTMQCANHQKTVSRHSRMQHANTLRPITKLTNIKR